MFDTHADRSRLKRHGVRFARLTAVWRMLPPVLASVCIAGFSHAQTSAQSEPGDGSLQQTGFVLRGSTGDPATGNENGGIFSDGGIEQANRDGGGLIEAEEAQETAPVAPITTRAGESAGGKDQSRLQQRERAVQPQGLVTDPVNTATPDPRANVRLQPEQIGVARPVEEDPFLPTGFRAGTWQVFTRLEQAVGYATNSSFSAGGNPGPFSQTDANVTIRSDWSRHQAEITADGSLRRSWGSDEQEIPSASVAASLRLDLIDGLTASLRSGYAYTTESTSSTLLGANVIDRPGVHVASASAELVRSGGLLGMRLRGSFDRTWYEDAQLSNGSVMSQADRNNNLFQSSARLSYAPSPAIRPFVQAGIGTRLYDTETDRNGDDRDSLIYDLRLGAELDFGEKLTGELAVGYLVEDFAGSNLESIDTLSFNAALDWSPWRGTTVGFTADTSISGSTTAGDSGSVIQNFAVNAERRVRDNFAVNASGSVAFNRYESDGSVDTTYTVGAGVEYWISRFLSVTGDVEYQRFETARPGEDWDSTSVRAGIAWQN